MTNGHLHVLVRLIRKVAGANGMRGATDVQLLERFAEQRDEDAFAALVQRHAPMVLGVCGRVLRDANDAEDAFQATFLVLVRKARSISRPNLLANWLYGVARRTALAAKTRAAKRQMKEKEVVACATADPSSAAVWADLRPVLDEEVSRLPARYRVPFVLCYLEGRTNEEAARIIGCPKGTVLSRLSWARERLRKRLTRRGLAPTAALLAAALSSSAIRAVVPPALARTTVEAALAFAAGTAPAASIGVVSLANGVMHHMFWTKMLYMAAFVAILGLIGGAGALAWQSGENLGPKAVVVGKAPPQNRGNAGKNSLRAQKAEAKAKETAEVPQDQDQKKKTDVQEVLVFQPAVEKVTDHGDYVGRTEAVASVELRSRVSGYLVKVNVKEGVEVKKGDVLFEIDPRTYQAELDRASAIVSQSADRLRRANAASQRAMALFKNNAISKEEIDTLAGALEEAEAGLRVAQASREIAALNLAFTKVAAPVNGIIGRLLLRTGSLVKADDAILATIVTQDPMLVHFDIDERTALGLRRALKAGTPNAKEWATLPVAMGLTDEKGFSHSGKIQSADSQVDPNTGTLRLRAVFANADGLLVPGLFCRVRLTLGDPGQALVLPRDVFLQVKPQKIGPVIHGEINVINANNMVENRKLEMRSYGHDFFMVKDGLKNDDLVVLEPGIVRAYVGQTVNPKRVPAPAPKSAKEP
ncbi:MAG TPA: efflux RND transporter periplasmic adaptor subunit [Gemmataceae bacterium]|jgi:multidrug efflux system membrane fusion protein|nr:efflux RND transporter periplasmic adaptor subunit [Gemmataceae bacterium]